MHFHLPLKHGQKKEHKLFFGSRTKSAQFPKMFMFSGLSSTNRSLIRKLCPVTDLPSQVIGHKRFMFLGFQGWHINL